MSAHNIWFFHHYATPPTMNGFIRPYNFAINLNKEGYKSTIFSASYLHFADINLINDNTIYIVKKYSDIDFVFINTPSSAKNNIARIKNMLAFYIKLFYATKRYAKVEGKPDLIIASSPHPLTMIAGIKISKRFKIPCICEIRDLWPETIFAFGLIKEDSILGKLLIYCEHWIYKKANALIFLKEGDTDYLKERKWTIEQGGDIDLKKCHYINNGIDINLFNKLKKCEILEDEDLHNDKFKVVYAGAIRPINNVGNILDAAKILKDNNDIQFLIYGDGNQFEILKQRIINDNLNNVKMKGYIDKKYIPYVLSKSSVNILNYSQNKYNWSRGNSSNKMFEYMASGKPIISTVKMGYCLLNKYNCGISLNKDTPQDLADSIMQIYKMPKEKYIEMCENAINAAKNFDYKILTKKLTEIMERLL